MGVLNVDGEELVRTYADMVYRIAHRYMNNQADAEDVFSETFLTYFKKERVFESEEHRRAWLIRVTVNCAKTLLGSRVYAEELNEAIAEDRDAETGIEEKLDLREAVARLPERQREIITLFYLDELSVLQIAQTLDMSEANVKVVLYRAREKLRTYLEG